MNRDLESGDLHLFAQMPFPCFIYDIATLALVDANPATELTYGYTRAELAGMPIARLLRADQRPRFEAMLAARAAGVAVDEGLPWVHLTRSGEMLAVKVKVAELDWGGRRARVAFVTDVGAQRAARREIKTLTQCIESASDMVVITAAEANAAGERPIVYVNRAFEQRTGYPRAEALGRDPRFLCGAGTDPEVRRRIREALVAWQPINVELLNYTRSGEPYWAELTLTPVSDEGGWFHAWFAVERDVSARRRAQQALTVQNVELEAQVGARTRELQKTVRDLESFSHSVSHDLQNPLSGVRGFVELLQAKHGATLPADAARMLTLIGRSADHMQQVIHDLLALSRIQRMEPRPVSVDLAALCQPVLSAWREGHPGAAVTLALPPGLTVHADLQLLRVVFENLVGNALKYSARRAQPRVRVESRTCDGGLVVSVTDNGAGFDAAAAHQLFTPFRRLHGEREFEGTGIGLAIVAQAVERLGGWVWAEARPDEGARFHLFLPAASTRINPAPTGAASPGESSDERSSE